MVDEEEGPGVWEVEHVLDADYGDASVSEAQTLSIEVLRCARHATGPLQHC